MDWKPNGHTTPGLGIKPGLSGPQCRGNTTATLPALLSVPLIILLIVIFHGSSFSGNHQLHFWLLYGEKDFLKKWAMYYRAQVLSSAKRDFSAVQDLIASYEECSGHSKCFLPLFVFS